MPGTKRVRRRTYFFVVPMPDETFGTKSTWTEYQYHEKVSCFNLLGIIFPGNWRTFSAGLHGLIFLTVHRNTWDISPCKNGQTIPTYGLTGLIATTTNQEPLYNQIDTVEWNYLHRALVCVATNQNLSSLVYLPSTLPSVAT